MTRTNWKSSQVRRHLAAGCIGMPRRLLTLCDREMKPPGTASRRRCAPAGGTVFLRCGFFTSCSRWTSRCVSPLVVPARIPASTSACALPSPLTSNPRPHLVTGLAVHQRCYRLLTAPNHPDHPPRRADHPTGLKDPAMPTTRPILDLIPATSPSCPPPSTGPRPARSSSSGSVRLLTAPSAPAGTPPARTTSCVSRWTSPPEEPWSWCPDRRRQHRPSR